MLNKNYPLSQALTDRRISRREFMKFCAAMTATLALPSRYVERVAAAVRQAQRPVVVWLEFQDCAGDTESFLRANSPSTAELILDTLSLNYHETLMVAAGQQAQENLAQVIAEPNSYLVVVEGAIPLNDEGIYCTIGGRTAVDIATEVCRNALATINCGSCSSFGGLPAAKPNPTGAVSVAEAVPGITVFNLPGCPMNVINLTATITHYLTFGELPPVDHLQRPLFAYGGLIHDYCERRGHFESGRFVTEWGDRGHQRGWCLYQMGCKGPYTYHNCPSEGWNEGPSWPVRAGHGCIGCAEPGFFDTMTPFYEKRTNDVYLPLLQK